MNCGVLSEIGKYEILLMGCYGIGVLCIVVVVIEQNYDKYGIMWLDFIVLFKVVFIFMNMYKLQWIKDVVEVIYV